MSKIKVREATISFDHVENALAAYLKPFFPEAVDIEGCDVSLPFTNEGHLVAKLYLRVKEPKGPANDNVPVGEGEVIAFPTEENKKGKKRVEKAIKRSAVSNKS